MQQGTRRALEDRLCLGLAVSQNPHLLHQVETDPKQTLILNTAGQGLAALGEVGIASGQ